MTEKEILQAIEEARVEQGILQETAASRAGISQATWSKRVNGACDSASLLLLTAMGAAVGLKITVSVDTSENTS